MGGFFDYTSHGRTGYQLCDFLRSSWLPSIGAEKLSVCEVMLTDERFCDLRSSVGLATAFWSHIQMEEVLGNPSIGTLGLMNYAQEEKFTDIQKTIEAKVRRRRRLCFQIPRCEDA